MDPTEPVALTVDLGGVHKLETLAIAWEFPAKSFVVSVSSDGVKWTEVFATDSNILASTKISLGSVAASKARVVMHEARNAHFLHSCACHHAFFDPGTCAIWRFPRRA